MNETVVSLYNSTIDINRFMLIFRSILEPPPPSISYQFTKCSVELKSVKLELDTSLRHLNVYMLLSLFPFFIHFYNRFFIGIDNNKFDIKKILLPFFLKLLLFFFWLPFFEFSLVTHHSECQAILYELL